MLIADVLFSFRLEDLDNERDVNSITLIERMVSSKPSERPPTSAILKHPFFWSAEKVLTFFQVTLKQNTPVLHLHTETDYVLLFFGCLFSPLVQQGFE